MAAITPDQIQDLFAQYKGYMIAVLETLEEGGQEWRSEHVSLPSVQRSRHVAQGI